ncbi:stage III sporulation protein AE [Ammoniphilus resinae]|uniref:Stage III sporulation protein AE n=1 Tax=Ammoniphilus resinae TaxID=861532 RepID=A0ABS4GVX0_9BACL|nr:stage III sporulation protein AE [Ammoniphilus resinae]MBP1934177.1 stage III sporulation protein AE [Ammoniphilus resinae]
MKRAILFLLFTFFLLAGNVDTVRAEDVQDNFVQSQIERLDLTEVEKFWTDLVKEYKGYLPGVEQPGVIPLIMNQEEGFSFKSLLTGFLKYLFHELLVNGKLLGTIIIVTVFAMILETMQSAFEQNTVSKTAYAISYMVLIILAINSFRVAISYAEGAIADMVNFMLALMPLVLTLLASTGNLTSVAMFHPLLIFMINVTGTIISTVIFPLLFLSSILSIVSSFSDKYKVTQLATLLRNISLGLLGGLLTIFLGIISVQGATSAVADGITIRTAKYVTSNFVPIVGRMFSDAADTVLGASLLVKNAVGMVGVVIIIIICVFPAIKIITLALVYNFSSAIMQPLGNSPIIGCLSTIGKNMIFVFAALATVCLMFFLALTIVITAANISVMVR